MAAFTVIDNTELSSAATSWSKSSIPSSYDHLLLMASTRSSTANTYIYMKLHLNGDTGSNYSDNTVRATANTPQADRNNSHAYMQTGNATANNHTTGHFGTLKMWIPNYANTTGYKQVMTHTTASGTSASAWYSAFDIAAGSWTSTAAINQIALSMGGGDFMQYSTFTLYGVSV
jgi:hypothetical protein